MDNKIYYNEIMNAVKKNDLEKLKRIEEQGVDLSQYAQKALFLAIEEPDTKLLEYLIGKGADVNAYDANNKATPLSVAVAKTKEHKKYRPGEHDICVKFLIDNGADANDELALTNAYLNENIEAIILLIKNGAKVLVGEDTKHKWPTDSGIIEYLNDICEENFYNKTQTTAQEIQEWQKEKNQLKQELQKLQENRIHTKIVWHKIRANLDEILMAKKHKEWEEEWGRNPPSLIEITEAEKRIEMWEKRGEHIPSLNPKEIIEIVRREKKEEAEETKRIVAMERERQIARQKSIWLVIKAPILLVWYFIVAISVGLFHFCKFILPLVPLMFLLYGVYWLGRLVFRMFAYGEYPHLF